MITELMTLDDCRRICGNLRMAFLDKDIAVVFDGGIPRVEVQN